MNELAKKDLFVCLGIWLALEVISFGILPAIGFQQPGLDTDPWFLFSLPLGIGGAFLMASSTQLRDSGFRHTETRSVAAHQSSRRLPAPLLATFAAWLGLLGMAYPILVMSFKVFTGIFTTA